MAWNTRTFGALFLAVCAALPGSLGANEAVAAELVGHLKPFGYQRAADYPIDEVTDPYSLTPTLFYSQYVETRRPVVFRGAAKHFKAYEEWTKDGLTGKYPKLELRIEPRKDGAAKHPVGALGFGRDTMEHFVESIETSDNYVVSELPSPMYGDVELLPCMSCGKLLSKVSEVNLWMSGGGTRSRLHRDAFNAINCQVRGTKDWIMVPANQTGNVYFEAASDWELGGLSPVNTDAIDLKKYPRIRDVPWGITTIEAGDCIYIPGGHYHQVRSYGFVNIAVSVLFSRLEYEHGLGFDPAACEGEKPRFVALSDTPDILWVYPGHGMMTMGCIDDNAIMAMIFSMTKGQPMTKKKFFSRGNNQFDLEDKNAVKKIWALLDTNKDDIVTRDDMLSMPRDHWRQVSRMVEPDVVFSNSYDYEYASLDYAVVKVVLSRAFKQHVILTEEDFVDIYTEIIRGSEYYGRKIFKQLDIDNKGTVSWRSVRKGRLDDVLEPFQMTEEEDGANHYADGDELADPEDGVAAEPDELLRRVLGQDEGDIEEDESLSDSEREMALQDFQERASTVSNLLGLKEGKEEDDDRLDDMYRQHIEKIQRESLEEDTSPLSQDQDEPESEADAEEAGPVDADPVAKEPRTEL